MGQIAGRGLGAWLLPIIFVAGCGTEGPPGTDAGQVIKEPEDTPTKCQDGIDNDGDGLIDCKDPDCWVLTFCLDAGVGRDGPQGDGVKPDAPADFGSFDGLPDAPQSLDGQAGTDGPPPISCKAHCDCPQEWFCYHGKCIKDPKTPVYCCTDSAGQPKAGCQPGRWCFEPSGGKGTCAESTTHTCNDACDCGPAHCCKYDLALGKKYCVKDVKDFWNPGGMLVNGGCTQGTDATYCCGDPLCHAGRYTYGPKKAWAWPRTSAAARLASARPATAIPASRVWTPRPRLPL